jgi:hypothetical protein
MAYRERMRNDILSATGFATYASRFNHTVFQQLQSDPEGSKNKSHWNSLLLNAKAKIINSSRHVYRSRAIHTPWLYSRSPFLSLMDM